MMIIDNVVEKPDNATLVVRRLLNAKPELAFEAWTSGEHIRQWMRPDEETVIPRAHMDLRVGGKFRIQMKMADGEYYTAAGEFQEVMPPNRLVYTWDWEVDGSEEDFGALEGKTSLITVDFIERAEKTEFVLTHTRFATEASRDSHAEGWNKIVATYARVLEKHTA